MENIQRDYWGGTVEKGEMKKGESTQVTQSSFLLAGFIDFLPGEMANGHKPTISECKRGEIKGKRKKAIVLSQGEATSILYYQGDRKQCKCSLCETSLWLWKTLAFPFITKDYLR